MKGKAFHAIYEITTAVQMSSVSTGLTRLDHIFYICLSISANLVIFRAVEAKISSACSLMRPKSLILLFRSTEQLFFITPSLPKAEMI